MGTVLAVLLVAVFAVPGFTLAWFSYNNRAHGDGLGITADTFPLKVEYARCDSSTLAPAEFFEVNTEQTLNFLEGDTWYPGYFVVFALRVTNIGSGVICVNKVGFSSPSASEESPRLVDGEYYYFGTQLSAAEIAVNGKDVASPTEQRLLTMNGNTPSYAVVTVHNDDTGSYNIAPGEHIELKIRITFVNESYSQDVYRNFGKDASTGERCQRRIFVNYLSTK